MIKDPDTTISGETAGSRSGHHTTLVWAFWVILAVTTLIRLLYSVFLPLTGDEAYFWEWARHPALSYYDHPPLAGWIIWLTRSILGDTTLAIRAGAVAGGTLTTWLLFHLVRRITGSGDTAALTGIMAMGIPVLQALGILYSTDTPLILGGTLGCYLFYSALQTGSIKSWFGLGLCTTAVLLSKFLGVALPAGYLGYLILSPDHRHQLRKPGPYIAAGTGAMALIPILWWNARHDWATFVFNFSTRHATPTPGLTHLADYIIGQFLAISPLVFIFAIMALATGFPPGRGGREKSWELPAFMALVPLGGFLLLSTVTKVGIHWPAMGVPWLVAATCIYLYRDGGHSSRFIASTAVAWTVTVMLLLLPLTPWLLPDKWEYPLRPDKINSEQMRKATVPTKDVGRTVALAYAELGSTGPSFIFTKSYALSSLVAFYTPGHPDVTVLGKGSAHGRNHSLWFEPARHKGENAVFVSYYGYESQKAFLGERFDSLELITDSSSQEAQVTVAKCYGFSGER